MTKPELQLKRDVEFWDNINWTTFEQLELEIQDGELVDVYASLKGGK
jgi:hypothetical protein